MPHQNPDQANGAAQNAATDRSTPGDAARSIREEPRSYVAADAKDATLAAPAAGEIGDFADEGELIDDELGEVQQGGDRRGRNLHAHDDSQGPKTRAANQAMSRSGSPDQGTQ